MKEILNIFFNLDDFLAEYSPFREILKAGVQP